MHAQKEGVQTSSDLNAKLRLARAGVGAPGQSPSAAARACASSHCVCAVHLGSSMTAIYIAHVLVLQVLMECGATGAHGV